MRSLLFITLIISALFECSHNNQITGTADDVNNGSLFGQLQTDGKKIGDTVTICLYDNESGLAKAKTKKKEPVRFMKSCNGSYEFDTLPAGNYRIEVTRDSIVVGEERGIKLGRNERKEINITIVIIINQTFNIWTDQSQHITINNIYIDNGKIEKADSGYVLSAAETDTALLKIEITENGAKRTIDVQVIRRQDGTVAFETVNGSVDVIIESNSPGKPNNLEELIGAWRGYELNGKNGWVVSFKKDTNATRATCYLPDGSEFYRCLITEVDKGKLPYYFKGIIEQCESFKAYQGKEVNCIYTIEHDTLYWGGSEPGSTKRPSSFTENGVRCFVMTRTDSIPTQPSDTNPDPSKNNHIPYFTTSAANLVDSVYSGDTYTAEFSYRDDEGDRVSITCTLPSGAGRTADSITWVPTVNQLGSNDFIAMIHDSLGRGDTLRWQVTVTKKPVDTIIAPRLFSPGKDTIINGKELFFSWEKVGGSTASFEFYLGRKPAFDSATATGLTSANIQFRSDTLKAGTYYWKVIARRGTLQAESETRVFTINRAPSFTSLATTMLDSIAVGSAYLDTVTTTDDGSDTVKLAFLVKPTGMLLNVTLIAWQPIVSDTGTHSVSILASDGKGGLDTLSWSVRVKPAPQLNHAPVFSTLPADMKNSINVDSRYVDTIHATDLDNDHIVFSFKDSVIGMQLGDSVITWTPAAGDTGFKSISVIATDGKGGRDTLQWNIRVLPKSTGPVYPEIGFDTLVSGEINPSIEVDRYQFQGIAGDKVSARVMCAASLSAEVSILDPSDSVVARRFSGTGGTNLIDTITLPATGTYMIRIYSINGMDSGEYSLILYSRNKQIAESPIAQFEQTYTDSINPSLEIDSYIFLGTAGDKVSLRTLCSSSLSAEVSILDPSNGVVASRFSGTGGTNLIDTVTLPASGTFMIRIESVNGMDGGQYSFILYSRNKQIAESPIAQFEQTYTDSINPSIEVDSYLFLGTAGDKVSLRTLCSSSLSAEVSILDPSNGVVASRFSGTGGTNLIDTVTLPSTGTYMFRIYSVNGLDCGGYTTILTRN